MKKKSGCWLIILCMLISLAGCGKQETALITGSGETVSQSSEMAAVTVNDEEISLREWNFYVRMNQMQWEKEELEDEGDEMWSQEVDEEGTTLEESLKEQCLTKSSIWVFTELNTKSQQLIFLFSIISLI